ncbi:hypothetical protein BE61_23690 [Bradyrhizobium elkanii USDA 61]|nr:hypothetical protein BE61_23690 [Bradyrhizobium elkanii USDA 61]
MTFVSSKRFATIPATNIAPARQRSGFDAASLSAAAQLAEADFCRQKGVRDWTIFADSMELRTPPALPSAWGG